MRLHDREASLNEAFLEGSSEKRNPSFRGTLEGSFIPSGMKAPLS